MAKAQVGTAKYQAKQLKLSGLQKLKFYCQICLKQCRDSNGFKNHLGLPSHLGRVANLGKDGKGYSAVEDYLSNFEKDFLRLLRINHGTKKINANKFYQEYILNDKNHVHMNATKWLLLTSFVKYLGQRSKVRVDTEGPDEEFNLVILIVDTTETDEPAKKLKSDEDRAIKFVQDQASLAKSMQSVQKEQQVEPVETAPVQLSLKGLGTKIKRTNAFAAEESDDE